MITILVFFLYDVYYFGERSRFIVSEKNIKFCDLGLNDSICSQT